MPDFEAFNMFDVGRGDRGLIEIRNAPLQARHRPGAELPEWPAVAPLSKREALNLAAWLVTVAGVSRSDFTSTLDAIDRYLAP